MKVLIVTSNKESKDNLIDYFKIQDYQTYFADSVRDAITTINRESIDLVIIELVYFSYIKLMDYLNNLDKPIKTIITAPREIKEAIEVFKRSDFSLLSAPFRFRELNKIITEKTN